MHDDLGIVAVISGLAGAFLTLCLLLPALTRDDTKKHENRICEEYELDCSRDLDGNLVINP